MTPDQYIRAHPWLTDEALAADLSLSVRTIERMMARMGIVFHPGRLAGGPPRTIKGSRRWNKETSHVG